MKDSGEYGGIGQISADVTEATMKAPESQATYQHSARPK